MYIERDGEWFSDSRDLEGAQNRSGVGVAIKGQY